MAGRGIEVPLSRSLAAASPCACCRTRGLSGRSPSATAPGPRLGSEPLTLPSARAIRIQSPRRKLAQPVEDSRSAGVVDVADDHGRPALARFAPGLYQPVSATLSGVCIVPSGSSRNGITRAQTPMAGMRIRRGRAASRSTTSTRRRCPNLDSDRAWARWGHSGAKAPFGSALASGGSPAVVLPEPTERAATTSSATAATPGTRTTPPTEVGGARCSCVCRRSPLLSRLEAAATQRKATSRPARASAQPSQTAARGARALVRGAAGAGLNPALGNRAGVDAAHRRGAHSDQRSLRRVLRVAAGP